MSTYPHGSLNYTKKLADTAHHMTSTPNPSTIRTAAEDGLCSSQQKKHGNSTRIRNSTYSGNHARYANQNKPIFIHTTTIVGVPRGTLGFDYM